MTLMLHAGAKEVAYDELRELETPPATETHMPIPHFRVVEMIRYALGFYGHEVVDEHHGITPDGMRYFGVLSLKSPYGNYCDNVGLRNSHDRTFPVGIAFGSQVFVCDNLSFIADHVIRRKHTANAKRDLPGLVSELIEPLGAQRQVQAETFGRYKRTLLTDERADHAIMSLYRDGVIGVQRIADVEREWQHPSFEEFRQERNIWRLFNAATFALNGRVAENPGITSKLHAVIDSVCEHIE
jgi:hypothetical protein